jgi:acetyl-CoA carboxylase carboxyltransferase component
MRRGGGPPAENLDDLVDPGSFVEYGTLAIAAQRARRELQELIELHQGRRRPAG